jgi:HlyD family secretion protein
MRSKWTLPPAIKKIPTVISNFITKIENLKILSKIPRKAIRPILLGLMFLILASSGYLIYSRVSATNATTTTTKTLQTATVKQGELVIYATGTGTLVAKDDVNLAFKADGQVTAVNVKVGDLVKAGDVLATVDDTTVKVKYQQAQRALAELTSPSAIAAAQEAQATAAQDVVTAKGTLEYLISPEVYHWELEISKTDQLIKDIKRQLEINPNDADAQANLKKKQDYLDFAESKLKSAKYTYEKEYIPKTFRVKRNGVVSIVEPSDAEILTARAAVSAAEAQLVEAGYLYTYLTGGEIPADATGSGLTEIEQARLDLESAKADLDGAQIIAPISGTVMSLDTRVGDTVTGSTTIITVADLSTPQLEVFLDASDWSNVKAGNEADVTFDIAPDDTYVGKVTQVDPGLYTESNSSVIRAIVEIQATESQNLDLPLGTSADVDVIGGKATNAILVPVEALHQAGDRYAVFVMENGTPKLQEVTVGIKDLLYAEIKSGLKPGDVVTTGLTATK